MQWVFLAGFFSGVASLFKAVGWAPLLAQFAFLLFLTATRQIRFINTLRLIVISAVGMLCAWLPFSVYFWRLHGFRDMIYASLTYNLKYGSASQGSLMSEPFLIAARLHPISPVIVCALSGLVWFVARYATLRPGEGSELERFRFFWPLVSLWVVADLCGAISGGRNYVHYFLCMVPSLSVAAGLAFWFVAENMPPGALGAAIRNLVFVLILGSLAFSQAPDLFRIVRVVRHRQADVLVQTVRPESMSTPIVEKYAAGIEESLTPIEIFETHEQAVSKYLNEARSPGDTLFTWNFLPLIYFETGMQTPTRFLSAHYLYDFKQAYDSFGDELLRDLKKAPPNFIVDGTRDGESSRLRWAKNSQDRIYQEFCKFVSERYELRYIVINDDLLGLGNLRVYARVEQ